MPVNPQARILAELPPPFASVSTAVIVADRFDSISEDLQGGWILHGLFKRPSAKVDDPAPGPLSRIAGDVVTHQIGADHVSVRCIRPIEE